MTWSPSSAANLAALALSSTGQRWLHTRAVARAASRLRDQSLDVSEAVISAAWLHDVGYAPDVVDTGFHALDGARWLAGRGVPQGVVSLVARHSGAKYEAEERGLAFELARFPEPDAEQLDVLTLVDMTVGPSGEHVSLDSRFADIFSRYQEDDPVHRAVTRSRPHLIAAAERAARRLGLADVRTRPPV